MRSLPPPSSSSARLAWRSEILSSIDFFFGVPSCLAILLLVGQYEYAYARIVTENGRGTRGTSAPPARTMRRSPVLTPVIVFLRKSPSCDRLHRMAGKPAIWSRQQLRLRIPGSPMDYCCASPIGCNQGGTSEMLAKPCFKALIPSTCFLLAMASIVAAQTVPLTGQEAHRRAEALLKQMTVEEKAGQMNQAAGIVIPGLGSEKPDAAIAKGQVGSVLWQFDVKELNRMQHLAVEKSRLHIPLIIGFDVIHGYRTVFPVPLAMASSWDPAVEEAAQHHAAQDARAAGIQWTFTPMVDIARDARWGRIVEGAGEDPYLGAAMAAAQVRGFQGESIGPESVLACVKHFAGYGAAEGGRDYDAAYIPEVLFRNVYLVPFHAAAQAGAGSFMSAYMDLNDVPASGNHWLLTDILRKEWAYKGFVVSDAFAVASLETHGYARDGEDA